MLQHCEMFPTIISMNLGSAGYSKPEKFEVAALFLRLGLPSTLIRHEIGAFENALQAGGFVFWCEQKIF